MRGTDRRTATWGVSTSFLPPPQGLSLPQLILLDEATFVFVQNMEHLLHVIRALFLQTHHLEELFVVEGVCSCLGVGGRRKLKRDAGGHPENQGRGCSSVC